VPEADERRMRASVSHAAVAAARTAQLLQLQTNDVETD
jgi:hypothetical protein